MRRAVLIFSGLLLIMISIQKWPLNAFELERTQTCMPLISDIETETTPSPETNLHTFFHSHRSGEFGHFHIFFSDEDQSISHHIVGASINKKGQLIKLFVTAPWVTHDDFFPLEDIIQHIVHLKGETWIEQLLKNHTDEIESLHTFKAKVKKPLFGRYSIIAELGLQQSPHALSVEIDQKDKPLK